MYRSLENHFFLNPPANGKTMPVKTCGECHSKYSSEDKPKFVIRGVASIIIAHGVDKMHEKYCPDCYAPAFTKSGQRIEQDPVVEEFPVVTVSQTVESKVEPVVETVPEPIVVDVKLVPEPVTGPVVETVHFKTTSNVVPEPDPIEPVVTTDAPKQATPKAPAVELAKAILKGERFPDVRKMRLDGKWLTECAVHQNAQKLCVCGGWHNWEIMLALAADPLDGPCYAFGTKCAAAISAAMTSVKDGVDPFKGAKSYQQEVTARMQRTNPDRREKPRDVPVAQQPTPVQNQPSQEISVVQKLRNALELRVKPLQEHFLSAQDAQTYADCRFGLRDAMNAYVTSPNDDARANIIALLKKEWTLEAANEVDGIKFTSDDAKAISMVLHGYAKGALDIVKDFNKVIAMTPNPERVAEAAQARAKREAAKAAKREADAELRKSMKGKSGGGGGQNQKKQGNGKK